MGERGRFERRTHSERVDSYHYTSREDETARDAATYHGPPRRTRMWVAGMILAVLVGFFVYVVATDDPDPCVGTPINANPDCDVELDDP